MKRVQLYSGGLDSVALRHLWRPDTLLYVDWGGRYCAPERARLPAGTWVVELPLARWEREDTVLPLRNLFFVAVAAESWPGEDLEVALGSVDGDQVLDQAPRFAQLASGLLTYLWGPQKWTAGRTVQVVQPLRPMSKDKMVAAYLRAGGDPGALVASYSCHQAPAEGTCGACVACCSRWVALKVNGIDTEPDCTAYCEAHYLPRALAGEPGYVPAAAVAAALGRADIAFPPVVPWGRHV